MQAGLLLILTLGAVLCMTVQPGSARVVDGNYIAEVQHSEYNISLFRLLILSYRYFDYKLVDFTFLFRLCPTWFELRGWLKLLQWPLVQVARERSVWPMSSLKNGFINCS